MVLIITSEADSHIGPVAHHLDEMGIQWIRLNTGSFATNVLLELDPGTGAGSLYIRDSAKTVELRKVRAVWYRKPVPVEVSHFSMERPELDFVEAEITEILMGLYALLSHANWINNPFTSRISHRKLVQLKVAKEVGFEIPQTIVTNDPHEALAFADSITSDIAIKSLGAISVTTEVEDGSERQYGIFTRRVTRDELRQVIDKVQHMPTLFQGFIEKQYELRITVVGGKVFACRIESRTDLPADDYRFDTLNVDHSPFECPEIHDKLYAYLNRFNLNFGCFDLLVTKSGQLVFLECNPNGQWLWVENLTGLQISKAIAEVLCGKGNGHN